MLPVKKPNPPDFIWVQVGRMDSMGFVWEGKRDKKRKKEGDGGVSLRERRMRRSDRPKEKKVAICRLSDTKNSFKNEPRKRT